jgi:hypothetical protein
MVQRTLQLTTVSLLEQPPPQRSELHPPDDRRAFVASVSFKNHLLLVNLSNLKPAIGLAFPLRAN